MSKLKEFINNTAVQHPSIRHIIQKIDIQSTAPEKEDSSEQKNRIKRVHIKAHNGVNVIQIVSHKPISRF